MVIESIPMPVGMAYAVVASLVIVILFRKDKFSKKIGYTFLVISTLFGFLVFAPMLPCQFQAVIVGNAKQLGAPIGIAIIVLVLFIILAFVFGRAFCGYVCPVGAIQELVYHIPTKKLKIKTKSIPIVFRLVFLLIFIVLALVFSIGVLKYLGIRHFFYLNFASVFFYVFLALLIVSLFVYRPLCRFFCPYGALLSVASIKGLFKIRRNDNCIDCEKCEEACPTSEAGSADLKQECYMCGRCKDVCPVDALEYTRKQASSKNS